MVKLNPVGAIIGVFNHHPENITCWAMENAIFDEEPVVSTTTTPLATSTTTTTTTSGAGVTTTTTKPYIPFPDEVCGIAARTNDIAVSISEITSDGWKLTLQPLKSVDSVWSAAVIFDENVDFFDEFFEIISTDARVRLRQNNIGIIEAISPMDAGESITLTIKTVANPMGATAIILNGEKLDDEDVECLRLVFKLFRLHNS